MSSMENDNKKNKSIWHRNWIVLLVMTILGIILMAWPEATLLMVCRLIAAVTVVNGLILIGTYLRKKEYVSKAVLVGGIVLGCIGVWIFTAPQIVMKSLPFIAGVVVLMDGMANLIETFRLTRLDYEKWWLPLCIAVITVGIGVLMILKPMKIAEFMVRVLGFVIVYSSVTDLWIMSRLKKYAKVEYKVYQDDDLDSEKN